MSHNHSTDSAGVPWEDREFAPNPHAGDDGRTPPPVAEAISLFRDGTGSLTALLTALADSRALIPLVTRAGDEFDPNHPVLEDKVQELAVVTVAGPNGENVLPAFTSVEAMRAWNQAARPIPIEFRRVCLAAAADGAERVVVNPGTDQVVVRRPQVWAIAQGKPVVVPWESDTVAGAVRDALLGIDDVVDIALYPGDPTASGNGTHTLVILGIRVGLGEDAVSDRLNAVRSHPRLSEILSDSSESIHIAARAIL